MAQATKTTDHEKIREWVEERGGKPTRVAGTDDKSGGGILRIDFGEPEDSLEEISWDEFFDTFEDRDLAFLYQDEKKSRFFKFVRRTGDDDN
jgi:hypothetical protein